MWVRLRAALGLILVAVVLGGVAAGTLGLVVWGISALFHHAASN